MQWDGGVNAGFSETGPWLAVNPNAAEINAVDQIKDPDSVFHHYRRLIQLRHDEPVIRLGDFAMLLPDDERVVVYTRTLGDEQLLVMANVTSEPVRLPVGLSDHGACEVLVATHGIDDVDVLAPWESRVVRMS
jgi:oligo-1,6-glucosidase